MKEKESAPKTIDESNGGKGLSVNKCNIFFKQYIFKSWEDLLSPVLGSVLLVCLYLLFESAIESTLDKYWVNAVIGNIQSKNIVIGLVSILLLVHARNQIKAKNFSIRSYEFFLLIFYCKYRFMDNVWNFHPISYSIKFFDALPVFVVVPKILAAISFYLDLQVNSNQAGVIDPDIPLGASNPKDELNRNKFAEELVNVLKKTRPSERALVIGINGTWGSGKTSLQYLIEKSLLTSESKDQFYLINFNPWFYSHSKSVSHSFITIVKNSIRVDEYIISRSLSRYANTVSSPENRTV